jgi:DNA polymerase-1
VHDELIFEVPDEQVETASHLIRETMSGVVQLSVPLLVSVGTGDNWDKASEH